MDHPRAIQVEFTNCGATRRSQADEVEAIRAPGEVLVPVVTTRMKERNLAARCRIERVRFV